MSVKIKNSRGESWCLTCMRYSCVRLYFVWLLNKDKRKKKNRKFHKTLLNPSRKFRLEFSLPIDQMGRRVFVYLSELWILPYLCTELRAECRRRIAKSKLTKCKKYQTSSWIINVCCFGFVVPAGGMLIFGRIRR